MAIQKAISESGDEVLISINTNRSLYTHYLKGIGIEIGALNSPLVILHNSAKVKYVDYKSTDDLKRHYLDLKNFVNVDIVTSAEDFNGIDDNSLDFIIANHVIEHLVNPVKSLGIWHRKLKDEGILFLAFPDAQFCPDKVRPITPLSHLITDYVLDNKEANDEHLLAFAYAWNPAYFKNPDEIRKVLNYMWQRDLGYIDQHVVEMLSQNRDCVQSLLRDRKVEAHHHVFNYQTMKELFSHIYLHLDFKYKLIDLSMRKYYLNEHIFILKKGRQCKGPFMDEFVITSEEKEKFLEDFVKEKAEFIEEQRIILDKRYDMIQELTKALVEKFPNLRIETAHLLFEVVKMEALKFFKRAWDVLRHRFERLCVFVGSKKT